MKWTIALALMLTLLFASGAQAQGPEVHCTAAMNGGLVQLDCYGPVMQEAYERLVPLYAVYDALYPIAAEWSFDLTWEG